MKLLTSRYILLAAILLISVGCAGPINGLFEREADLRYYRAVEFSRDGLHEEALKEFLEAIRLEPEQAEFHRGAGLSLSRLGRLQGAVDEYTAAVRLDESNPGALLDLGVTQTRLGRFSEAAATFERAYALGGLKPEIRLVISKNLAVAYDTLGVVAYSEGRHPEAVEHYTRAIEVVPEFLPPYIGRARAKWALGYHDAALGDYDAALGRAPSFAAVYLERGLGLYQIGRDADGAKDIKRALGIEPGLLVWIAGEGRADDVARLLENDADTTVRDTAGNTAIMAAAAGGHARVVETLIEAGSDPLAANTAGLSPLLLAASGGRGVEGARTITILTGTGAKVNARTPDGGTALMRAASSGDPMVITALLDAGAVVDDKDAAGSTALLKAAENGRADAVRLLAKKGANVNARDSGDISAMGYAALNGHADVIAALAGAGADVDVRDRARETPLMWAILKGHRDAVSALLDAGADEDARSARGVTPLMVAAGNGRAEIVETLLAETVRVRSRDSRNVSALLRAEAFGHAGIADRLREAGATQGFYPSVNAIVFGRIIFVEDGVSRMPYGGVLSRPSLHFLQLESGRMVEVLSAGEPGETGRAVHKQQVKPGVVGQEQHPMTEAEAIGMMGKVEDDGSFFWRLPRGTYVIPDIYYGYRVTPKTLFQVPIEGDAVYVGTLTIRVTIDKVAGSRLLREVEGVEVGSEFYSALAELNKRFGDKDGNYTGEVLDMPMRYDPELPSSVISLTPVFINDRLDAAGLGLLNETAPGTF